ncbi:MAG: EscN/YscN/HrcN family type III secretion system ATPase [Bacteroidetes bacterium 4572_77]|nr:MAG: EscN/YscN/HrcN family type III secretion system ATPase [Bacteroidetes bacterium 4572_77]
MLSKKALRSHLNPALDKCQPMQISGRVSKVSGSIIESIGPKASVGEICHIKDSDGAVIGLVEVVGFSNENVIQSMPLGFMPQISPNTTIISTNRQLEIPVGENLLGRTVDSLANPLDGKGEIFCKQKRSIYAKPPNPLLRKRIFEPIKTGIRAIDGMLTIGKGQRMGIFSGSGVGKSVLIGMLSKYSSADVNVIALIGERGREVREFIEKDLGDKGLTNTILVVETGDKPPLLRVKAALTATTIAEYFRDQGLDVMLIMDSITRLAMAQREIGLATGEPPTTKGYTPSVFNILQSTMERAGTSDIGSITALYSVLVEGDDINEPVSDTARGVLDGHIVLSRKLANMGHYPAIEILESISRLRNDIIQPNHLEAVLKVQKVMAAYRQSEDLISVGAYQKGSNHLTDKAIATLARRDSFLSQGINEVSTFEDTITQLIQLSK